MKVLNNREIRDRLKSAFPKFFINQNFEIIIYPPTNSYFNLTNIETETELKAKILEWTSREAGKSFSLKSRKYHLEGINKFLNTDFTHEEMDLIYTSLGNACNHRKTLEFLESGYDFKIFGGER